MTEKHDESPRAGAAKRPCPDPSLSKSDKEQLKTPSSSPAKKSRLVSNHAIYWSSSVSIPLSKCVHVNDIKCMCLLQSVVKAHVLHYEI